jgi:hypothetical protein
MTRSLNRDVVLSLVLALGLFGCGGESAPTEPEDRGPPAPPAAPNFFELPIPLEYIARISPVGVNNWTFPTPHTYWLTCDFSFMFQADRPCQHVLLPIRAPAAGIVRDVLHAADGFIRLEGPPGLMWHFGHVTPAEGLAVGSTFRAGQVLATMHVTHGFDFGVINYGRLHSYVAPHRYHDAYLRGEHPIAQFPEPLRSQLMERVRGVGGGLGRLDWDVKGTAAGYWYIQGSPNDGSVLNHDQSFRLLFLGRLTERPETRILSTGTTWPGMLNWMLLVDAAEPAWDAITPATGPLVLRLRGPTTDGLPTGIAVGAVRVHLFHSDSIRVEWFATHDLAGAFTTASRVYTR